MDYNHMTGIVTNIFEQDFERAYGQLGSRGKSGLLRYFFSFYRKWQSSAMIDNTFLTPSNILSLINKEYHKKTLTTTVPTIKSFKRFKKFEFREISYTLDAHPVVEDLRKLLTCLAPTFNLSGVTGSGFISLTQRMDGYLEEALEEEIMSQLSLQDPFYVAYLIRISAELGFTVKMPSLYSNKMQLSPKFDQVFGGKLSRQKSKDLFAEIVAASLRLATSAIDSFLPTPGIINMRFVTEAIKKSTSTDEIFRHIYGRLGFDFDQVAMLDLNKPFPDEYHDIVSGTFALGAIMSLHLVTVFGLYLRLINPVHIVSNNMSRDMTFVLDALNTNHDIEMPLFTPCTFFTPTSLGIKFFKLPREAAMPLPSTPTLSQLIELIENMDSLRDLVSAHVSDDGSEPDEPQPELTTCEFKVKLANAPDFWKRMLFLGDMTLDEFAAFVAYEFFDDYTADYSFHNTQNVNRFTEVLPPRPQKGSARRTKRREKHAEITTITEFLQTSDKDFLLIIRDQSLSPEILQILGNKFEKGAPVSLFIKYIGEKVTTHKSFYPRVTGKAKVFWKLEPRE